MPKGNKKKLMKWELVKLRHWALLAFISLTVASCNMQLAHAQAPQGFTKLANVSTTTFSDATCGNQNTCYYAVTAVDSVGHESSPALCDNSQLCFATNQAVVQMPSSGTHTVGLSWGASTTSGVSYNVYRSVGPVSPTNLKAIVN
jgi:hypothetical protein